MSEREVYDGFISCLGFGRFNVDIRGWLSEHSGEVCVVLGYVSVTVYIRHTLKSLGSIRSVELGGSGMGGHPLK